MTTNVHERSWSAHSLKVTQASWQASLFPELSFALSFQPAERVELDCHLRASFSEDAAHGCSVLLDEVLRDVLRVDVGVVQRSMHVLKLDGFLDVLLLDPEAVGLEVPDLAYALPLDDAECCTGVHEKLDLALVPKV